MKAKPINIKEAPGYQITEDGQILNMKTKKIVTVKDGKVRLNIDGKRKTFDVDSFERPGKQYPYKIRNADKIAEKKATLTAGDKISFIAYKTNKKLKLHLSVILILVINIQLLESKKAKKLD